MFFRGHAGLVWRDISGEVEGCRHSGNPPLLQSLEDYRFARDCRIGLVRHRTKGCGRVLQIGDYSWAVKSIAVNSNHRCKKQSARATHPLRNISQRDPKPVTETVCHVKAELTNQSLMAC